MEEQDLERTLKLEFINIWDNKI